MNLYISNLSYNISDEDLRQLFADYGEITSAKVIMDRETGRSRGFGFVELSDDELAKCKFKKPLTLREVLAKIDYTNGKRHKSKKMGITAIF